MPYFAIYLHQKTSIYTFCPNVFLQKKLVDDLPFIKILCLKLGCGLVVTTAEVVQISPHSNIPIVDEPLELLVY